MTPTTLEGWIYLLQTAQYKKRSYSQDGDNFNAFRYLELEYWARDRIINKYGESKFKQVNEALKKAGCEV